MQELYNSARDLTKDTLTLLREVETAHTKLDAIGTITAKTKAVIEDTYDSQLITESIAKISEEIAQSENQTVHGLNLAHDVREVVKEQSMQIGELSAAITNNIITVKNNHQLLEQTIADGQNTTDENLKKLNDTTNTLQDSIKEWIDNPIFDALELTKTELSTAVVEIEKHQNERMEKLTQGHKMLENIVQNLEKEIIKYRVTNGSVSQTVTLLNRLADNIDKKIENASPTIGIKTAEELESIFEQNGNTISLEDLVTKLETSITPSNPALFVVPDDNSIQSIHTLEYIDDREELIDDVHLDDEHSENEHSEDENLEDEHSEDEHSEDEHSVDEHSEDEHFEEVNLEDVTTKDVEHVTIEPSVTINEPIKVEFPEPTTVKAPTVEPKREKHGFFSKFFGMKG